jgi:hypothetical protein
MERDPKPQTQDTKQEAEKPAGTNDTVIGIYTLSGLNRDAGSASTGERLFVNGEHYESNQ